ncbi:unnamed protein product, partial [Meganyctiphanes norvegica]
MLRCSICDFICISKLQMASHFFSIHTDAENVFGYTNCDFKTLNKKGLQSQSLTPRGIEIHEASAYQKQLAKALTKEVGSIIKESIKYKQTGELFDPIPLGIHSDPDFGKSGESINAHMYKCPLCEYKIKVMLTGFKSHRRNHMKEYYINKKILKEKKK